MPRPSAAASSLALPDQRAAHAAAAHAGKQTDIDEQMLGRALQVIATDRAALAMFDREEVGIAEMLHVVFVLQPELLVEEIAPAISC